MTAVAEPAGALEAPGRDRLPVESGDGTGYRCETATLRGEPMNDRIWMGFNTLKGLDGRQWFELLRDAEKTLGTRLSRLDVNDPVRRKVERLEEAAEFVCRFGEKEESRRLFGRFDRPRTEISISLFRGASRFPNDVTFFFPTAEAAEVGRLCELFSGMVGLLEPFYAFCDLQSVLGGKRKGTGAAVDLEAELIGVFWLTHFNRRWVDFIGAARFDALPCERTAGSNGVTLRLGETPMGLGSERDAAEELLGRRFFVDPGFRGIKRPGDDALTFAQLRGTGQGTAPPGGTP